MTTQATAPHPQSLTQRLGLASGLAFVGFLFAAIFNGVDYADGSTQEQITAWYASHGGALTVPVLLEGLALTSLLIFLARLAALLREHGEGPEAGMLIFGSALLVTVLRLIVHIANLAQVLIAQAGGGFAAFVALDSLQHLAVHFYGFPLALMIGALTAALFRTRVVPRPVAALGLLAALLEVIGTGAIYETVTGAGGGPMHAIEFYGVQLFGLFVLASSVTLLVQSRPRRVMAPAQQARIAKA